MSAAPTTTCSGECCQGRHCDCDKEDPPMTRGGLLLLGALLGASATCVVVVLCHAVENLQGAL